MKWSRRRVIVTGGAGFIGGALVDRLLSLGSDVTVVDKTLYPEDSRVWLSKLNRLDKIYKKHGLNNIQIQAIDLTSQRERFRLLASSHDVVFHLGAVFGGREFVDIHQSECSEMLTIDHNVISESYEAGIEHVHYSSSACVYPPSLNKAGYLLKEDDILSTGEKWLSSDNLYGFAKLMGEMQLLSFHKEHGLKSSASRYLTVYGPGELDASHAIAALIEKALDRQDPYVVWGSGKQERGFTYVDDIVSGTILGVENIQDGTPINLGWDRRYKIREVAKLILETSEHNPKRIEFDLSKPEGPFSRALDIARARKLLGWEPKVDLREGLSRTIQWHSEIRQKATEPVQIKITST
jgi:nucleoside-diphosphate-sugar epimerase